MRKLVAAVSAATLVLGFALCGCAGSNAEDSDVVSTESAPLVTWTEASTAEEAAAAAGVEEFVVPAAGSKIELGELGEWTYYHTDNMVEADGGAAAAEIIVRKSTDSSDNAQGTGAITGAGRDISEATYAADWNTTMDGTDVHCYGSKQGTVSKAIWSDGKYGYTILVLGQGDNWQEFGVSEGDIATLVKGTK